VKRCSTCGQSKSPEKFFAGMAHCKACHNGVTMSNLRRSTETRGRQQDEPTEDQIAAACLLIQQRWSKKKRASRKRGKVLA